MELRIDGLCITPQPGQSLLQLVRQLGLDKKMLSQRPLAAKIAGEVFTLNYIPVRRKDALDASLPRKAMAASGGSVRLLRYGDALGREAYIRTAQFVIFLALRQLWPGAQAKISCTLGESVFIQVSCAENFSVTRLKARIEDLVKQDIPLLRRRVSVEDAITRYSAEGQTDKARLLNWRTVPYFDEYTHGDFADYYYGEMLPSTGYITVWDILAADGGLAKFGIALEWGSRGLEFESRHSDQKIRFQFGNGSFCIMRIWTLSMENLPC